MLRSIGVLIIAACISSSAAESQCVRSFGLMLGATAASQDWAYAANVGSLDARTRWGIDVGGFVEWLDIPILSISTEVHYVQKGFKIETPVTTAQSPDGNGSVFTLSPRVDYLSIPIVAKCRLDLAGSSLYAFAGPRVDFLVGSNDEGFGAVLDKFKSTEYGATMGLGVEAIRLGSVGLGAQFRYSPTLQDSYATNLLSVRNRSLEMLIVVSY